MSNAVKNAKAIIITVIVVLGLLIVGLNSFYTITEQEKAVITTFGVARAEGEPGLHFKVPFVQSVQKVSTTSQGFTVGYNDNKETIEEEGVMITSDYNFVNVDFYVGYKVVDPIKYVYASQQPVTILKNISQSCIRTVIGNYDVDSVLTTGKNEIQNQIKEMIEAKLQQHDVGLFLETISIQDSQPPTQEVLSAFKDVENAKQNMDTLLNNAKQYQSEQMLSAEATVDQILQEAQSKKTLRINEAKAEVAVFNAMYDEFIKNPIVTKQRMFYETMEEVLPNLKVIIDGTNQADTLIIDQLNNGGMSGAETGAVAQNGTGAEE